MNGLPALTDHDSVTSHDSFGTTGSTYNNNEANDRQPQVFMSPMSGISSASNQHLVLQTHHYHSNSALIRDEQDAKGVTDNELETIEQQMNLALQSQIDQHQRASYDALPRLRSMSSLKSLKLDTDLKPMEISPSKSGGHYTPTLKTKETKELCEKLDEVNVLVNDINQHLASYRTGKSSKSSSRRDRFLQDKLSQIQDHIEDSEMYIEEHIDHKFIEEEHERTLLKANNDKQEALIAELRSKLEQQQHSMMHLNLQIQQQNAQINQLQSAQSQLEKTGSSNTLQSLASPQHAYDLSVISELSVLPRVREMEEKEGGGTVHSNHSKRSGGQSHDEQELLEFEMKRMKQKVNLESSQEVMKYKQEIHQHYYHQTNQFILKITQSGNTLPRQIAEIVNETKRSLTEHNTIFQSQMDELRNEINQQRRNFEKMKSKPNLLDSVSSCTDLQAYDARCAQHEEEVRDKTNELHALNMNSLQLKLDLMDIVQSKRNTHYQVFLHQFVRSISRIFFDCKVILSAKFSGDTPPNPLNELDHDRYMDEDMKGILDTIPLTTTIIKVTDILSNAANYNVSVNDLKKYVQNIENFRLSLIQYGYESEYEFCQKFAVQIIHAQLIKLKKYKKDPHHYIKNKVHLMHDVFVSIIAREFGANLMAKYLNNDVNRLIELIIFMIKYPPVLNQVDAGSYYRKKHRKNYKRMMRKQRVFRHVATASTIMAMEEEEEPESFESLIKSYYNLYGNKSLIKNLKKFEKYMRRNRKAQSDSEFDSDSSDEDDGDDEESDSEETDDDSDDGKATKDTEETNSFSLASLLVKCIN